MRDFLSIFRIHIVLIAIFGTILFGWFISGRYLVLIALIVGIDWMLINGLNRVSDITEDLANKIPGTERIARNKVVFVALFIGVLVASFIFTVIYYPELTFWRISTQIVGFLYSFKIIPTSSRRVRLKDFYFFKNFLSASGFLFTCFGYTLANCGYAPLIGWPAVITLILFFVPYELTFEIFYDLRDVQGDTEQGVKTYPVVHGKKISEKIINYLLAGSVMVMTIGFLAGTVGVREFLMIGGPINQFFILRPKIRQGPTTSDCIWVTNLGSFFIGIYLIGAAIWLRLNLPENIFLKDLI